MSTSSGAFIINSNGFFIFNEAGDLTLQNPTAFDTSPTGYSNWANPGPSFGCAIDRLNGYIYYNRYNTMYCIGLDGTMVGSFQSASFPAMAIDAETGNVWGVNPQGVTVYSPQGAVLKALPTFPGNQIAYDDSSNAFWIVNSDQITKVTPAGEQALTLSIPGPEIIWNQYNSPSPTVTTIQSIAIDPVAERLWVLTGTTLTNYNNLSTGATIRVFDLQGNPLNAFLFPVNTQRPVSTDLTLQADYLLGFQYTQQNASAQYLVLSPQSGMALVCCRLFSTTVNDATNYISMLAFTHDGRYAATPLSANALQNSYFTSPLCAFDGSGNLWGLCSSFANNGAYQASLSICDPAFKSTITNTTTANAAAATQMSSPSIPGYLLPFGNFTSNAAIQTAEETAPQIDVRARLIQNYQPSGSATGGLSESTCYRVDIFTTQNKLPRITHLKLWSAASLTVQCRGAQVDLSPLGNPAYQNIQLGGIFSGQGIGSGIFKMSSRQLVTDANGRLTLDIPASDIDVCSIFVQADFMSGSSESIVINPAQQVHAKLAKVTAADLQNPNAQGGVLLDPATYSAEQAESVASAIRTVMSVASKSFNYAPQNAAGLQAFLAGQDVAEIAPAMLYRQSQNDNPYVPPSVKSSAYNPVSDRLNVSYLPSTGMQTANLLVPELADEEAAHWSLTFSESSMTFTPMTMEAARQAQVQMRTAAGYADPFTPDFSLGDLWDAFVDTGKSVAKVVVTTVNSVVDQAVDGVKQLAQKVIVTLASIANQVQEFVFRTVEQAAQFVKGIFNQVGIAMSKALDYLKSIFGWDDIINTKNVIKHQINQLPVVLDHIISIGQLQVTTKLTSAKIEMANTFKSCRQQLAALQLQSGLNEGTAGEDALKNVESQWFINAMHDNAESISSSEGGSLSNTFTATLNTVRGQINTLIENLGTEPGFLAAQQCFERMSKNPSQIPNLALSALISIVEGIAEAMIDLTIALINIIATVLKAIIDAIFNLLNMSIDIPLLSDLYKRFVNPTGMSMLDLVCLVIAGAATPICKAMTGNPPFTNADVVALTQRQYPGSYVKAGLMANEDTASASTGTASLPKLEDLPGYTSFNKARSILLTMGYAVCTGLTTVSDVAALSTSNKVVPVTSTPAGVVDEDRLLKGLDGFLLALNIGIAGLQWDTWALSEYRITLSDEDNPSAQPSDTDVAIYQAASMVMGMTAGVSCLVDFIFLALEKLLAKQDMIGAGMQSALGMVNIVASIPVAVIESKYAVKGWPENTVINISDGIGSALSFVGPALQKNPQTRPLAPVAAGGIDLLFGGISTITLAVRARQAFN